MKDIAPELLEKIQEAFQKGFDNSQIVKRYKALLAEGKATYVDANAYAVEVGNILAKAYKDNISADVLPDGRMYFNIAKRVIDPTMANNHDLVADYCEAVQTELNKSARIGIKAIRPELDQDKIDGIINRLSEEETFEKISWILQEPVVNFTESIVDIAVSENAKFQHKAGLKPKIIRKETGNCCDWCKEVAGSHEYPDVPEKVYRRHRYCRCTVEYDPVDGKRINVHTKKESGSKEDIERRKQQYERWVEQDLKKKKAREESRKNLVTPRVLHLPDIATKKFAKGPGKNYPIKFIGSDHLRFDAEKITNVTIIAGDGVKSKIRDGARLQKTYGYPANRWKKISGTSYIRVNGEQLKAEIHWYEANGQRKEIKVKRIISDES